MSLGFHVKSFTGVTITKTRIGPLTDMIWGFFFLLVAYKKYNTHIKYQANTLKNTQQTMTMSEE